MKTLNDVQTTTVGAGVILSLILAPVAAAVILPFWVAGKFAELLIG